MINIVIAISILISWYIVYYVTAKSIRRTDYNLFADDVNKRIKEASQASVKIGISLGRLELKTEMVEEAKEVVNMIKQYESGGLNE